MVNTIHMSCVVYGLTVHYKSLSTEYTAHLSGSFPILAHSFEKSSHLFLLNVQMPKMIRLSSTNQCVPTKREHISSNHDCWLNSFNIKQFHKINFYVVESTISQTCSGPIEFLHVAAVLLNGFSFSSSSSQKQWNTKQMFLNQHRDEMDTFLPENFEGTKMGTMHHKKNQRSERAPLFWCCLMLLLQIEIYFLQNSSLNILLA